MKTFLFSIFLLFKLWFVNAQINEWSNFLGPNYNITQDAPVGKVSVSSSTQIKKVWESQDITPLGNSDVGTTLNFNNGGGASSIVSNGKVYQYYFQGNGKNMDTVQDERQEPSYNALAHTVFGNSILADDIVVCMDVANGKTLWKTKFKNKGYVFNSHKGGINNNTPCVWNNRLYVLGSTYRLYCLNATTGALIWESTQHPQYAVMQTEITKSLNTANRTAQSASNRGWNGALLMADSVLIVPENNRNGQGANTIFGFNPFTGVRLWTLSGFSGNESTPTVWKYNGKTYLIGANSSLKLADPKTGLLVWTVSGLGFTNSQSVIVDGDDVFLNILNGANNEFACYSLSFTTATKKWSLSGVPITSEKLGAIVKGNRVYYRSNGIIYALDRTTGAILKSYNSGIGSSDDEAYIAIVGDLMWQEEDSQHSSFANLVFNINNTDTMKYLFTYGGPSGFEYTTSYSTCFYHPITDGKIIIRSRDKTMCFDLFVDPLQTINVEITTPDSRQIVSPGATVGITATASTTTGSITKVEFYDNGLKIDEKLTEPYSTNLNSLIAGTHLITAKAYNSGGQSIESNVRTIVVKAFAKLDLLPDTVRIMRGARFHFNALAIDQDGDYFPYSMQPTLGSTTLNYSLVSGGSMVAPNMYMNTIAGIHKIVAYATINGVTKSDTSIVIVAKSPQTVTFDPQNIYVDNSGLKLYATATSGLPISFSIISGPGTLKGGDTLVPNGTPGLVIIKASQPGNSSFEAAENIDTVKINAIPVLTKVVVTPDKADVPFDGVWVFSALAYDQNNELMPVQPTLNWTAASGGSMTSEGIFNAGSTVGGPHNIIVSCTEGAITVKDTAKVNVIPHYRTISVNFGPSTIATNDYAGVIFKNTWNNKVSGSATLSNMLDDKGTTTTAGCTSLGIGATYTTLDVVTNGDSKLMKSSIGNLGAGTGFIYVTGLPSQFYTQGYDVYVYWQGHDATTRTVGYSVKGVTYYLKDANGTWDGTFDQSTATTTATAVTGKEYVKFTGLTTDSFSIKINSSSQRWGISGIQIVTNDNTPIVKNNQTITWANPGNQYYQGGLTTLTLNGTLSSGLPVYYTVISGPASVAGNVLTINGLGSITLKAWHPGNEAYNEATPVQYNFNSIAKIDQTISWSAISDPLLISTLPANLTLTATASSGLAVVYTVLSGAASVTGNVLKIDLEGDITLQASQPGNTQYNAAASKTQLFEAVLGTGLKENVNSTEKRIYPNPVLNYLNIQGYKGCNIQLLSVTGQVLQIHKQIDEQQTLDLSGLARGMYLLQLVEGDKISYKKIIKK